MTQGRCLWFWCCGLVLSLSLAGCNKPEAGHVEDEARRAGRPASSFPAADEDYFHDMDQDAHGHLHSPPTRSRAATCGWFGPAATTDYGTR